jgi:4-nitrophenyl phosphatase
MTNLQTEKIKALILDMDGVIWRGEQLINPLAPIMEEIHQRGWRVMMATNNSSRSPEQYVQRLQEHGVEIEAWQVINSSEATAHYLSQQYLEGGPVYIIGEDGMSTALNKRGFQMATSDVLAVVAGFDRHLTYQKLKQGAMLIRAGAEFVGTNPDKTFPTPEGLAPGAGAILAALEAASDVTPTIIGKPKPAMFEVAIERLGTTPEETLVVGDRLETDIAGAQRAGCLTALVLSGVSTAKKAEQWDPAPDIIADDLKHLLTLLE